MKNRRELKRRYLLAEVTVKPQGSTGWLHATLTNISQGGIGIYSTKPLKKKERVSIKIAYLEGQTLKNVEEIPGKVCWVLELDRHYAAGIQFEAKVSKKNYPILTECLEYAKAHS